MIREITTDDRYIVLDGDELICLIESVGNNKYHAHNLSCDIIAEIVPIDDYKTSLKLISHKLRCKDGRYRKRSKLAEHDLKWLNYMLQKHGIIRQARYNDF